MWIAGWFSICMFVLYQPFMNIWMRGKEELVLSFPNMTLFCLYFYAFCMTYTKGVYLEGKGLFWECRKLYVLEAFGNLALNILLGYFFGITGILIATIVTIFAFNFIGGTMVLFRHYFKITATSFYLLHARSFIATVLNAGITYFVCSLLTTAGIGGLILKTMICIILPNVLYMVEYRKTIEFKDALSLAKRMIKK